MRVYHRTHPAAARAIAATGRLTTRENTPHAYASTRWDDDCQGAGYGPVVVELDVPDRDAIIDDDFGDEQHYRVPLTSRVVSMFTVDGPARVPFT